MISVETIISLIESTTTKTGLTIRCQLDTNKYELGSIVTDGMLERIKLTPRPASEGEKADCSKQLAKWNYTIQPRSKEEQTLANRLDEEEITAEKIRVKRKYNKKPKESN